MPGIYFANVICLVLELQYSVLKPHTVWNKKRGGKKRHTKKESSAGDQTVDFRFSGSQSYLFNPLGFLYDTYQIDQIDIDIRVRIGN